MTLGGIWIQEAELYPRGYGVAWLDPVGYRAYCLPIPFNRVAGCLRAWYLSLKHPSETDPVLNAFQAGVSVADARLRALNRDLEEAYRTGFQAGLEMGDRLHDARSHAQSKLDRS